MDKATERPKTCASGGCESRQQSCVRSRRYYWRHRAKILARKAKFYREHREELKLRRTLA